MDGEEERVRGRCDCACFTEPASPAAESAYVESRVPRICTWDKRKCRRTDLYFLSLQSLASRCLRPDVRGAAVFSCPCAPEVERKERRVRQKEK